MVVPTGNHLLDSNVCYPGGKPWHTELVHVIIHIYEIFIHHGVQSSFYRVVDTGVKLHPFPLSRMILEIKKNYVVKGKHHHDTNYTLLHKLVWEKCLSRKEKFVSVKWQRVKYVDYKNTPAWMSFEWKMLFLYWSYKVTIFLVQIRRDRTLPHGLLSVGPKCHAEWQQFFKKKRSRNNVG